MQHGIFAPTPNGPAHPGHFLTALLNKRPAETTGGTFIILMEDQLARLSSAFLTRPIEELSPLPWKASWDEPRESMERLSNNNVAIGGTTYVSAICYWADQLLADLHALGIGPTSQEALAAQGFKPGIAVKWQSDNTLTQHYWELFGLERDFGPWPPPMAESAETFNPAVYFGSPSPPPSVVHPYVVLNWAIEEMSTGRTYAIDGEDLRPAWGQLMEYAYRLQTRTGWQIPEHFFVPVLGYRRPDTGKVQKLSSSAYYLQGEKGPIGHPWLREAVAAGIDRETLTAYIDKVAILPEYHGHLARIGHTIAPVSVAAMVKPDAVIKPEDWQRFLETGQVSKPRKKKTKR